MTIHHNSKLKKQLQRFRYNNRKETLAARGSSSIEKYKLIQLVRIVYNLRVGKGVESIEKRIRSRKVRNKKKIRKKRNKKSVINQTKVEVIVEVIKKSKHVRDHQVDNSQIGEK